MSTFPSQTARMQGRHRERRAGFYKANALRAAQMERIGNHDDSLRSLGMTLSIAPFDAAGRKRIAQLFAKSNQFNLTSRRHGEAPTRSR